MNIIHTIMHDPQVILGGLLAWVLSAIATYLPNFKMLIIFLHVFNIKDALPWMQAIVFILAGAVSVLTIIKLVIDLGWYKKKK